MDLIKMMPLHYQDSSGVAQLQKMFQAAVDSLEIARENLVNQFDLNTVDTLLPLFEIAYGIDTDSSISNSERRSKILSKIRSDATATIDMIKNVVSSFENGKIEIIEDNAHYKFKVKFMSNVGTPRNIELISSAIDEIKPAHLSYEYIIIFVTHCELGVYTHSELGLKTHNGIRNGV